MLTSGMNASTLLFATDVRGKDYTVVVMHVRKEIFKINHFIKQMLEIFPVAKIVLRDFTSTCGSCWFYIHIVVGSGKVPAKVLLRFQNNYHQVRWSFS
jgi:hypothetical protein